MAGLKIKVPGAFSKYIDITEYPISDSLSSLFYLGDDAAASAVNYGSGADATVGGSVTFGANYAEFSGNPTLAANRIETTDANNASAAWTRIAIFRNLDASGRMIYGLFMGDVTNGGGILDTKAFVATGAALAGTTLAYGVTTDFHFVAQRYAGGSLIVNKSSGGELGANLTTTATQVASTLGDFIGGNTVATAYTGVKQISMVAKHQVAISDAQLAVVFEFAKLEAARRALVMT